MTVNIFVKKMRFNILLFLLSLTAATLVISQSSGGGGDASSLIRDSRIIKIEKMRREWANGGRQPLVGRESGSSPAAEVASLRREAAEKMGSVLTGIFQDTREKQVAHLNAIRIAKERMREMQAALTHEG